MAIRTTHKWTKEDRELLCLLKRKYGRKYTTRIFNQILLRRLAREGFTHGMTATSLDAQYQEVKNGGRGYEIYARISTLSENDIRLEHPDILRDIQAAISTLRLDIRPKMSSSTSSTSTSGRRRRRPVPPRVTVLNSSPTPAPNRLQHYMYRPSPYFLNRQNPTNETSAVGSEASVEISSTVLPALRINTDSRGNTVRSHPLLLFRATEDISAFRSRKFTDTNKVVPDPDEANSKEFRDIIRPHLQRDKSYPSPIISFAQNPRNALRRIETTISEDIDQKMFLAIFSFNELEDDLTWNFGPGSGPYLVQTLYSPREISDLPDGYTGRGEWLIYGFTNCEPLAVLDSDAAITLAKASRRLKVGDLSALFDLRASLRHVPYKWREAVAYVALRQYCGESGMPKIGTPAYRELVSTIVDEHNASIDALLDFSRPSVDRDDLDYRDSDDDDEETRPTTSVRTRVPLIMGNRLLEDYEMDVTRTRTHTQTSTTISQRLGHVTLQPSRS